MSLINDLDKIGAFLVDETRTELAKKQKRASGALIRSFKSKTKTTGDGYEIAVFAASYFKFVEHGVNGTQKSNGSKYSYKSKKPPIEPLLAWIRQKGSSRGDRTLLQSAFALQSHIYRNGVKGINILEDILKKESVQYVGKIADSMTTQMSIKIDSIIKNGTINK